MRTHEGRRGKPAVCAWRLASVGLTVMAIAAGACDFGDISVYELPPRESRDLTFVLRTEDATLPAALGWGAGIPEALVEIVEDDSTAATPWRLNGLSDGEGRFHVGEIPDGRYRLSVTRILSEDERARAGTRGTMAFLLEATFTAGGASDTLEVSVPSSDRRSLVISEWEFAVTTATGASYIPGGYIELYNNADTIIYLDGKLIGRGYAVLSDLANAPCAATAPWRVGAGGLYSTAFEKFPGNGRDYPLAPGEVTVVAVDAIDHRPFTPNGFDLSGANFEFRGSGDVDNPTVPNMINVGLREGTTHGLAWPAGTAVAFVSDAVDVAGLARSRPLNGATEYALFPAAAILDVLVTTNDAITNYCIPMIDPVFSRDGVRYQLGSPQDVSLQRRPLLRLPGGALVLRHTRSSKSDWYAERSSPGDPPPFRN
jgi:hypothetical protein